MNSKNEINIAINRDLTEILYRNLPFGLFGIALSSVVIVWQLIGHIDNKALFTWFILLNLNLLGGYGVIYWYQLTKNKPEYQKYHFYAYLIGSGATALMLGILCSFLMPPGLIQQMLVILIVVSITGASVQNLHASYLAASLYLGLSLIPLLLWESQQVLINPQLYLGILIATFIFSLYLAVDVYSGYKMVLNNIKIKFENIVFADKINYQKNILEMFSSIIVNFQKCIYEKELYQVLSNSIEKLFPGFSLILFFPQNDEYLKPFFSKNTLTEEFSNAFLKQDCFAVSQDGPYYSVEDKRCKHLKGSKNSAICIPLSASDEFLGVMTFISNRLDITDEEKNLMHRLAADLALAIVNLRLREHLKYLSTHDALTNLYNRYFLHEILDKVLLRAAQTNNEVSFFLLDIDYFKEINDRYGHDTGDIILSKFSTLMKDFFTESSLFFRYGGEEFLIVLENSSSEKTLERATAFLQEVKHHQYFSSHTEFAITISGGIATFPKDGRTTNALITVADKLLYQAKNEGRGRIFTASSHNELA